MSSLSASSLIDSPRGARLCMAVAEELGEGVRGAVLGAAWHPSNLDARAALVSMLQSLEVESVGERIDVLAFAEAGRVAVGSAMYWQEPDDIDRFLRDRSIRLALLPIAEAVTRSPATRWWTDPVDLSALRFEYTIDEDENEATPESISRSATPWEQWRNELLARSRRLKMTAPLSAEGSPSGYWWSTPSKTGVLTTTRPLPGLPAVELMWQEDTVDPQSVALWRMTTSRVPRVFEIDQPATWVDLVRRYPLDTTGEHRGDWYSTTGRDGTWHTPDWAAVAKEYDAVHLTVAAYFTTAGRALDVCGDGDVRTMLAGWSPDQTWWLDDALTSDSAPQHWTRINEFGQPDEH